jgi:signal transduction histidine kinase
VSCAQGGSLSPLLATIDVRQHLADTGWVLGDGTQIQQVIMNLGTNAHHAMRETGGILLVTLENLDLGEEDAARNPDLKPAPIYASQSRIRVVEGMRPARRAFSTPISLPKVWEGG